MLKIILRGFTVYYCFQLTEEEYKSLRCKKFTLNKWGRGEHSKYMPYVFTKYGITILAGLLKSQIAVNASIKIVDTFIEMRKIITNSDQLFKKINDIEHKMIDYDKKIDTLFNELQKDENFKQKIFLKT